MSKLIIGLSKKKKKKPRIQVKMFKLICVNAAFQDETITGFKG